MYWCVYVCMYYISVLKNMVHDFNVEWIKYILHSAIKYSWINESESQNGQTIWKNLEKLILKNQVNRI